MPGPYLCVAKPDVGANGKTVKVIRGTINGASAWCDSALTMGFQVQIRKASMQEVVQHGEGSK